MSSSTRSILRPIVMLLFRFSTPEWARLLDGLTCRKATESLRSRPPFCIASYHAASRLASRRRLDHDAVEGGKQWAEPLAEPVDDRVMVLCRLVDDGDLPAPPAPFSGEFRLVALELRGLPAADREDQRMVRRRHRHQQLDRAVAPSGGGVQAEHSVEIAEADRLEIEDAADRAGAADWIAVEAEARPVGQHRHRREMTAGGVTGEKKAAAADAEALAVGGEKGDRASDLRDDVVHAGRRGEVVIDDGDGHPDGAKGRRDEAEIALVHRLPVAAMEEHQDRRPPTPRPKEIEGLPLAAAIGNIEPAAPAVAHRPARPRPPRETGRMSGHAPR